MAEPLDARSPGITYQELLDTDSHEVPEVLRLESPAPRGMVDVSIDRYISHDFHDREMDRLWSRVWQFACREEHIPESGDYVLYEIGRQSYVVIRTEAGAIKCFVNACLHRGRQLKQYDGRCSELRCPYHGFAWETDGRLKDIPAQWDFPQVVADEFALPEAAVGTWAGFVFINPDPDAASLESFLGDMPAHFERWKLGERYVQAHIAKEIRANWKIAQEAFSEAFHANATHPQTLPYLGDTNSQVDVWDNFSRVITPGGTPSPLLDWEPNEADILRYMLDIREDMQPPWSVEGTTARLSAADSARERWRPVVGDLVDEWSDAEFIDNLDYTLFPNFHPWGAFNRIVYRFRPNGDDHRSSIMEVLFLAPFEGARPPPAKVQHLGPEQSWTDASDLGLLGKVFDQDTFNMERVQKGLETTRKQGVTLGGYQEAKVRWLNETLDQWLGANE
ncbi:MAG: aromatic ring-hydroxylating dioxygenase subunit alpha [Gammaproteobacteria bacterium]|nr:aromatic ring-hydroxylating dioxygenase subunit alpha [Gammaproteobacteria bacterium]